MSKNNIKDYPANLLDGAVECDIPIDAIVDTRQTQIREAENADVIDELIRHYQIASDIVEEDGDDNTAYPADLPPIVVVACPGKPGKYWIIDGHHRYRAAVSNGMAKIRAWEIADANFDVKDMDDLHFLQARENIAIRANRTTETKRRQVAAALKKRPNWTKSQIAHYCYVSFDLVSSVMDELNQSGEAVETKKPVKLATDAIAKPENVNKSNRQLAKELGVNEKTVRQVRKNSEPKKSAPQPADPEPAYTPTEHDKQIESNLDKIANKERAKLPAEPAKVEYQKPEILDAPPELEEAEPLEPVEAPEPAESDAAERYYPPKEIVVIEGDGSENRFVGYALSMFATVDEITDVVLAACGNNPNKISKVYDALATANWRIQKNKTTK